MFNSIKNTLAYILLTCAISISSFSNATENSNPVAIYTQTAALNGAMNFAAKVCGGYNATELARMKQDQQAKLMQSGMSDATFDELFARGFRDAELKWQKASKAEQQLACEKMKQPLANMQ